MQAVLLYYLLNFMPCRVDPSLVLPSLFVIVVRSELPVVSSRRKGVIGPAGAWRSGFSNDFVDGSAVIAQHEHDFNDPCGGARGNRRRVQVDLHAACAVRIHRIGARLARSKLKRPLGIHLAGLGCAIVHAEIDLRELARTVEVLHAHDSAYSRCSVGMKTLRHDRETVIAREGGITAAVVIDGCPSHTAECKQKSRDCEDAFPTPAVHLLLLLSESDMSIHLQEPCPMSPPGETGLRPPVWCYDPAWGCSLH